MKPIQTKDNWHTMEFPLKGMKPWTNEGRDHCCRTAAPTVRSTSLPAPMVSGGHKRQGWLLGGNCSASPPLLASERPGLWHKPVKFTSYPLSASPRPLLVTAAWGARAQGNSLRQQLQSEGQPLSLSQTHREHSLPALPRTLPTFHDTMNNKASPAPGGNGKEAGWVPPSGRDQGKPLDMWQAWLATHRFSSPARGQRWLWEVSQVSQMPAAEEAFLLCRGVGRWVRALPHPAQLSTASLFSGWTANERDKLGGITLSYGSDITEKETGFVSSSSLL